MTIQRHGRAPKFSDAEVITLSLVSESLGIDSENHFFMKLTSEYADDFPHLIERSRFNRRRRRLQRVIDMLRAYLAKSIVPRENTFILDSMPIEVCKVARGKRARICREDVHTAPEFGFCASQNQYFYGYKIHGICSLSGVFISFDLTKANIADVHYLQDVRNDYHDCLILADKGYLSNEYQLSLFNESRIRLNTPMRSNQHGFKKQPFLFRKTRKRVETMFSQLCDQFMIRRNYAKTFDGLVTRIISKISAFTLLQYINKFINYKPLGHIKHALA
ncbi:IS982 family transposase [candidate division KSB1 bacterium]